MPTTSPTELRRRALALRQSAQHLDRSGVRLLPSRAGADTWIGPTARRFLDTVEDVTRSLAAAEDDLLSTARWLEHQAVLLESAGQAGAIVGVAR